MSQGNWNSKVKRLGAGDWGSCFWLLALEFAAFYQEAISTLNIFDCVLST
jgi:hypothetical protein